MLINMLKLLNMVLLISNSVCDRKLWMYTANVRDKQNWMHEKIQSQCNGLNFPDTGSLNDFVIGEISVKRLVLPKQGGIGLYSGSKIIFDENSPDVINCVKLKPVDAKFWNDIQGWKNLDDPDNPAVPYIERLPSRYDDVIFNDVMDARILSLLDDRPVKTIIVRKGNPSDMVLSQLYPNGRFIITNETCVDPTGCPLTPMKAPYPNDVCYYASMVKALPKCEYPITPLGFCQIPMCGASIIIGHPKMNFRLRNIKRKLQDYGSFTHVSKVPDSEQVQVIFTEANFSGISLSEARDFHTLLQKDESYFCENVQLLTSGLPLSDDYKVIKNGVAVTLGTLLVAIIIFALLILVFSPVFGHVDIRTRILGNRPLTTYVLRYDNIHDRSCVIDAARSLSISSMNLNQSFENPIYDQSTSRSTSNETLASIKLVEKPNDVENAGSQMEDVEKQREFEKVQLTEEVKDESV